MTNDFYTKNKYIDFLDYMNEMNRIGKNNYIDKLFLEAPEDINLFITKIKSLGLEINEYMTSYKMNPYRGRYNNLLEKAEDKRLKEIIINHIEQVEQLQNLFIESNNDINKEFERLDVNDTFILVTFIIYLEYQLRLMRIENSELSPEEISTRNDILIFCSGNILKYIFHKIDIEKQNGISRIFSMDSILWNVNFYLQYQERDKLMDAFEYWKYSDIQIKKLQNKIVVDFLDEDFNRSVLVSNYRQREFMTRLEVGLLNDKIERDSQNFYEASVEELAVFFSKMLCQIFIGKENFDKKVYGVEIKKWIETIYFFKHEAFLYFKKKKNEDVLSVQNLCIIKEKSEWINKLVKFSTIITKEDAVLIIDNLNNSYILP